MNREILFRGKDNNIEGVEWVYGYYVKCKSPLGGIDHVIYSGEIEYDWGWAEESYFPTREVINHVDHATVGQYTGMTDKNGVKIFEGDIVHTIYNGIENVFVVVWDNDELDFKATNGKENYGPGGFQYMPCCEEVEVIGNIYDNPDLLEGTP